MIISSLLKQNRLDTEFVPIYIQFILNPNIFAGLAEISIGTKISIIDLYLSVQLKHVLYYHMIYCGLSFKQFNQSSRMLSCLFLE